ncbi:MAG TPA: PAS domain S-box protein, partial [Vicinamibacterales bacterium]|nr:PAS domain S-box protein [Vicinamibacterales bacterium]
MITRRELRARLDASTLLASLLSLFFVALAVAVRWLLDPWLGDNLALVTLYGAVAAAVWIGGYTQGVAAAIVGYLACDYLFVAPRGTFGFSDPSSFVGALTYTVTCAVIVGLGNAAHEARHKAHGHSELLRTTLASIGDAVVTTDLSGRVTSINRMAETLLGRTERDARGELLSDVFGAVNEDRSPIENPATLVLREDRAPDATNRHVLMAKDGTERLIDDNVAPIRDENGQIVGGVLTFRDVTDRRKAELAREKSERELADFFENASVALHWIGPDGVILRANHAELAMLGYTREEYVGQHISKFHVDRDVIDDALSRLLRGDSLSKFPARMRHKNGSIKKVLIDSNSLWDKGRFLHSRCLMFDVTEQKREEETRSLLAAIVSASDDAIVSMTLEGIILTWNQGAQRLFGYSPAEAVGRSVDLIIPKELRPEERQILQRIRQGDRVDHFETIRVSKDGRRLDISLTVSPVREESGRVIGASKVARDVTERKQMDEAMREADRRKD